jgi:hypothetical protein
VLQHTKVINFVAIELKKQQQSIEMPIITLTTDFGTKDPYVSAVKGAIYTEIEQATIVDISNEIKPFNITEAAYVLKNAYAKFPKGTIHIVTINVEETLNNKHIVACINEHFFICADNGLLSLIFDQDQPDKVIHLSNVINEPSNFSTLDRFVKAACKLCLGTTIEELGDPVTILNELSLLNATINEEQTQITGNVIYIDHYGNIVTSITKAVFNSIARGRNIEIVARTYSFYKIYESYTEFINEKILKGITNAEGERLAMFNSAGYLQISIFKGSKHRGGTAFSLLGLYPETTTITVYFK